MKYIVIDPSGSFSEGKGQTGVTIMLDDDWSSLEMFSVKAKDFSCRHLYWEAIANTFRKEKKEDVIVIIESFIIRTTGFLMGQMPETIQLIGMLRYYLEKLGYTYVFQAPTLAKSRFRDMALPRYVPGFTYDKDANRYYLNGNMTNDHMRDALKHLLYFKKYGKIKGKEA